MCTSNTKGAISKCFFFQAVIRALCAIIDAFHFPTAATSAEGDADISADATEIQTALTKRVLPALQVHLVCLVSPRSCVSKKSQSPLTCLLSF